MKRGKIISIFLLGILFLIPFVLSVEDPNILSGSMGFIVTIRGGMICEDNGTQWRDYTDPANPIIRNTLGPNGNCYSEEGINGKTGEADKTCCPLGSTCTDKGTIDLIWGTPLYGCEIDTRNFCSDFNQSESSCTEDGNGNPDIAWNTIDSITGETCGADPFSWAESEDVICQNITHCKCIWDAAGKCNALQNKTTECSDGGDPVVDPVGTCTWVLVSSEDHCNDGGGYIDNVWDGTWDAVGGATDLSCTTGVQQRVDCSSIVMMGFFDENMFIISVFLILIIYLLQLIINKNKSMIL